MRLGTCRTMTTCRTGKVTCESIFPFLVLYCLLWSCASAETSPRPTRCGDFCSVDHINGYVGPLDTTKNLQDALNGLSYEREIVIAHHAQLDFAYQMVHRWQRFGYGHVLLVFPDHVFCHRIQSAFPKLGCGWYDDHVNMAWIVKQDGGCKGCTDKWLIHYTGARAVRMGYNVLVADADTMPLYDFYGMIRSPPYKNITLFNQREGAFNVNGGMYYIQNAARDGPAAYVLYDHILKNVRWYEDTSALRRSIGLPPNDTSTGIQNDFLCNDQFSLSDSVHGAITGRPQILECVFWHHPNRSEWEKLHLDSYRRSGPKGADGWGPYDTLQVPVPEPLRRGSGGAPQGELVTAPLRIPHSRGEWPPERGGYPFNPQLGPLARHVVGIFREAGGDDAAPFPDPAEPTSAAAADAARPENFAYFPPWIANTHSLGPSNNGNDGWYNDHLTDEIPAAISHLHAGLTAGDFTKIVHFAVEVPYGWDFDVALRVAPQTAPYLGTELHGHVPPLVALAPGVAHPGLSQSEFAALMQGLMRVGLVLNRVVVWPWVPCEAPFLRKAGSSYDPVVSGHKIPWSDYINTSAAIPNGPETKSLKAGLRCLVTSADKVSCLRGGTRPGAPASAPRGLLPHEFDHWVDSARRGAGRADPAPSPANTLQDVLQRLGGSVAAPPARPGAPAPPLELTPADLSLLTAEPSLQSPAAAVLWLRGPVVVQQLPSPELDRLYDKVKGMCCILYDTPSRECIDRPPGAQLVPS